MRLLTKMERYRPRLFLSALIGICLFLTLPAVWRETTRLITAWNTSITIYLVLVFLMMLRSDTKKIKYRASQQDERGIMILVLVSVSALASIVAIVAELSAAKSPEAHIHWTLVALTAFTVFLSWSFLHTSFALHYAHDFYDDRDGIEGGLDFPSEKNPDYWDFIYYSFIIGTAAATADVNITSRNIRRITTVHCILAFFFNTTILGLTVNIAAGLF